MMMAYIVPFTNQAPLKCSKLNSKCNLLVITMKSNTSNLHLLQNSIRASEKHKLFNDVYKANNSICESQHDKHKYQNTESIRKSLSVLEFIPIYRSCR